MICPMSIHLSLHISWKLAHALLMPQIVYSLDVGSISPVVTLNRLRLMVHLIVRFVCTIKRSDHMSRHFQNFLACSFSVKCRTLVSVYTWMRSGLPLILCDKFRFSHCARNPQLYIPRIYRMRLERLFVMRAAYSWNWLSYELRVFSLSWTYELFSQLCMVTIWISWVGCGSVNTGGDLPRASWSLYTFCTIRWEVVLGGVANGMIAYFYMY